MRLPCRVLRHTVMSWTEARSRPTRPNRRASEGFGFLFSLASPSLLKIKHTNLTCGQVSIFLYFSAFFSVCPPLLSFTPSPVLVGIKDEAARSHHWRGPSCGCRSHKGHPLGHGECTSLCLRRSRSALELSAAWPAGSSGSRSTRPLQPLSARGLTGCCLSSLGARTHPDQPCSELGSSEFSCLSPLVQSARTSGLQQSRMRASSFRPHSGLLAHGCSLCG